MFPINIHYKGLYNHVSSNPPFIWGLLCDCIILPFTIFKYLLTFILGRAYTLDSYVNHNLNLPPLILVHGSNSHESQLLLARFYLRNHFNVYAINFETSLKNGVKEWAGTLNDFIIKIYNETNKPITLVGHSMGGLVCSYCVETNKELESKINKICTISSPMNGASALLFVDFGCKKYAEMTPNSNLLEELHDLLQKSTYKYVFFGSPCDYQVNFFDSFYKTPNFEVVKYQGGHNSAVVFPFIWNTIKLKSTM